MNPTVLPDGLIAYSMYRCVLVLSVLLCLCESYELFGIVVLPMRRSPFPSSQSPSRRQFSNREPVWHGATSLSLWMTRASKSFVSSDVETFAPDPHTLGIAKRLQAELKSHYTVAEFLSDMPHGTSRHNRTFGLSELGESVACLWLRPSPSPSSASRRVPDVYTSI